MSLVVLGKISFCTRLKKFNQHRKRAAFDVSISQAHGQCQFTTLLVDSIFCQVSFILLVFHMQHLKLLSSFMFHFPRQNACVRSYLDIDVRFG